MNRTRQRCPEPTRDLWRSLWSPTLDTRSPMVRTTSSSATPQQSHAQSGKRRNGSEPSPLTNSTAREKANLDITWLRDELLADTDNLPAPHLIAREIIEDLTAALVGLEAVAVALEASADGPST